MFSCMYLAFDDGEAATDPRIPPLREPPPPDAGFRCLAEEDRSEGGSPRPCERGDKKSYVIKSIVSKTKTTLIDTKRYM